MVSGNLQFPGVPDHPEEPTTPKEAKYQQTVFEYAVQSFDRTDLQSGLNVMSEDDGWEINTVSFNQTTNKYDVCARKISHILIVDVSIKS